MPDALPCPQSAKLPGDVQLPLHGPSNPVQHEDATPRPLTRSRRLLAFVAAALIFAFAGRQCVSHRSTPLLDSLSARPDVPSALRPDARNPAYLIEATHGAVATENGVCSQMGVDILRAGGNAVDAAISACLCIGVVNMFSSGIGGGGFMTVRVPPALSSGNKSEVWSIDFREVAPAAANHTMFVHDSKAALYGGLAVGVPGELRGLAEAHRRWGALGWARVVRPSAELARGFAVGRELARRIQWFPDLFLGNPDWSAVFAPAGVLLREGEVMRRANLARTLDAIAAHGADAFYEGSIADALVRKIASTGGIMTPADLASYRVHVARALQGQFMGQTVYVPGAPTSGPVLLHMLKLAERLDLGRAEGADAEGGCGDEEAGRRMHLIVECLKFGFAARTRVCDPAFNDRPERIDEIPTQEYADHIFKRITERTHSAEYYHPEFDVPTDHGTSHISAYSEDGFAVSLTSTVNLIFGSQVMDPETGVILNDEMDDFSTPGRPNAFGLWPSPYNYPAPGKRPLSSTTPLVVESASGAFRGALGGSGGARIFGAVFQTLLHLARGADVRAAVERGRVHDQLFPPCVDVDDVVHAGVVRELRARGHNVSVSDVDGVKAVVNAVVRTEEGRIFAASDSRKNGIAAGW